MSPRYADQVLAGGTLAGARLRASSGPSRNGCGDASVDARRFANLLRDPEAATHAASLFYAAAGGGIGAKEPATLCWPSDRGTPTLGPSTWCKSPQASARLATAAAAASAAAQVQVAPLGQQQLDALADRMSAAVASVQRQCEAEKRALDKRIQQIERQFQSAVLRFDGERAKDDGRDKLAELQGSFTGLADETQALSKRVDGLDERLWTRTNSAEEAARQGIRELQQQLQALERQMRLSASAAEEQQRRQTAKQRRTEHFLEDFAWRLTKAEEEQTAVLEKLGAVSAKSEALNLAPRLEVLEASNQRLHEAWAEAEATGERLHAVEAQLASQLPLQAAAQHASQQAQLALLPAVDEEMSMGATRESCLDRELADLERKVSAQLAELAASVAAVKVKVDSQQERQLSLSARFETAHLPAVESLRSEAAEVRTRDLRDIDGRLAELSQKVELASEAMDTEHLAETLSSISNRLTSNEALVSAQRRDAEELRAEVMKTLDKIMSSGPSWNGLPPPLPRIGEDSVHSVAGGDFVLSDSVRSLQDQLTCVADQLDTLEDLSRKVSGLVSIVSKLERRCDEGDTKTQAEIEGVVNRTLDRRCDEGETKAQAEVAGLVKRVCTLERRCVEGEAERQAEVSGLVKRVCTLERRCDEGEVKTEAAAAAAVKAMEASSTAASVAADHKVVVAIDRGVSAGPRCGSPDAKGKCNRSIDDAGKTLNHMDGAFGLDTRLRSKDGLAIGTGTSIVVQPQSSSTESLLVANIPEALKTSAAPPTLPGICRGLRRDGTLIGAGTSDAASKFTLASAPNAFASGQLTPPSANVSRRTSFDSARSAEVVCASADESVDNSRALSQVCDTVLDVIPPGDATLAVRSEVEGRIVHGRIDSKRVTPSFGKGSALRDSLDVAVSSALPASSISGGRLGSGSLDIAPEPSLTMPQANARGGAAPMRADEDDAGSDEGRESYVSEDEVSENISMDDSLAEFMHGSSDH